MKKILREEYILITKPQSTCRNCKHRTVGCHSVCEDYISYRKKLDEYNKTIKLKKTEDVDVTTYFLDDRPRRKKRR